MLDEQLGQTEWRRDLSLRLARLSALLTALVLLPLLVGIRATHTLAFLSTISIGLMLCLLWLSRPSTPHQVRSIGVVVVFSVVALSGFASVGFLAGPSVAYASAVVFAGLLLGRRAMFGTGIAIGAGTMVIAAAMVLGALPSPAPVDLTPLRWQPWLRSLGIALLLILILGAVVLQVIESIETAKRRVSEEQSRRSEVERQLLQAQSVELVGQLAAGFAHDVNNQLTVIGASATLLAQTSDKDKAGNYIDAMHSSIEQAASLTHRLLMLGRHDVSKAEHVQLAHFFEDSSKVIAPILPSTVHFSIEADDEAWCVIDPSRLNQVLLNLVVNARDALSDDTGSIEVTAHALIGKSGTGRKGAIPRGSWMLLAVSDSGNGMTPEVLARAWDPFFTTKACGKGTGLGLSTIASIIEDADGHIGIESTPGRGTRIEIWLPLATPQSAATVRPSPQSLDLDGLRVLVVDDAENVRTASAALLSAAGAEVETAHDGDSALEKIAASAFDILCSDVVMPGAHVLEVVEAFSKRNPSSSALLCSAYVQDAATRALIDARDLSFLAKPYRPREFIQKLAEHRRIEH